MLSYRSESGVEQVLNWRTIGTWSTIYIALALPSAILLGKLLHQAALRSIPAIWVEPGHHLPCFSCGEEVQVHWQEDGIWLCCPICRSKLPAERYQVLMHREEQPTG